MPNKKYAEVEMNYGATNCLSTNLDNFLHMNGKFVESVDGGLSNSRDYKGIFYYKSSVVVLDVRMSKLNVNLRVISDNESKAKEVFGELEKVISGKN